MQKLLIVKNNLIFPLAFVQRNFGRTEEDILHLSLLPQITSVNRRARSYTNHFLNQLDTCTLQDFLISLYCYETNIMELRDNYQICPAKGRKIVFYM